jgi:hypothetical protein
VRPSRAPSKHSASRYGSKETQYALSPHWEIRSALSCQQPFLSHPPQTTASANRAITHGSVFNARLTIAVGTGRCVESPTGQKRTTNSKVKCQRAPFSVSPIRLTRDRRHAFSHRNRIPFSRASHAIVPRVAVVSVQRTNPDQKATTKPCVGATTAITGGRNMAAASHVSIFMARFDEMRTPVFSGQATLPARFFTG